LLSGRRHCRISSPQGTRRSRPLVLGAAIAAAAATEAWWIAPLMGAAIVIAFVLSLAIDVRRA
jgi:hypothetical protein